MKELEKNEQGDEIEAAKYIGYVIGVYDSLSMAQQICVRGITTTQIVAVATKFLKENPERWNAAGEFLLRQALTQAFPCKK